MWNQRWVDTVDLQTVLSKQGFTDIQDVFMARSKKVCKQEHPSEHGSNQAAALWSEQRGGFGPDQGLDLTRHIPWPHPSSCNTWHTVYIRFTVAVLVSCRE